MYRQMGPLVTRAVNRKCYHQAMDGPQKYEVTPISAFFPVFPEKGAIIDGEKGMKISVDTLKSLPVDLVKAFNDAHKVSEEYRERYRAGDRAAPSELVRINRCFFNLQWVKEALYEMCLSGRGWNLGRGRQKGTAKLSAHYVIALVRVCESKGMSKDKAFHEIGEKAGLSYDRVKRLYYDALKSPQIRPYALETGPTRTVTKSELEEMGRELGWKEGLKAESTGGHPPTDPSAAE